MLQLLRILIYYPFLNLLLFFIWLTPGHYAAVGIVLLTLLVRFILIIPSKRAAQMQRKIAQLQPLMDDLKKEYGDDRQGMAVAQMDLYKKNNINPFSSCLLSLIQLPVLLILYRTFRNGLVPNSPHLYSWMPHLAQINNNFFGINLSKPEFWILPILAALLQFVQVRMTTPKTKPKADGEVPDPSLLIQRNMLYIFPVMTFFIARNFASGIALYWIVTTLFSIVQQYFVNREKYNIQGVEKAMEKADKEHPGYHRSEKAEKEIIQEATSKGKGDVSVTVRRKKS